MPRNVTPEAKATSAFGRLVRIKARIEKAELALAKAKDRYEKQRDALDAEAKAARATLKEYGHEVGGE